MKLKYCLWAILLPTLIHAQTATINGSVRSAETGKPLPGAVIHLHKANITLTTNDVGRFTISDVLLPDTMNISLIGYRVQSVPLTNVAPITILLEQTSHTLDSVLVSTGYQRIPKERATGSFGIVGTALLSRSVSSSILDRIESITPGILFNHGEAAGTDALLIRGRSTIYANASPLIVLDNFPYDGNISNINPNDIESVTILKDAAAASIWGARAGNGVIVITTKKGRTAAPQISFTVNTGFIQKPDLFAWQTISSAEYIDLEKFLFQQGWYDGAINDPFYGQPLTPVVELLAAVQNGSMDAATANAKIETFKQQDARNDLADHFYRTALQQQYALNISGVQKGINYFFSAGLDRNNQNLVSAYDQRITLRSINTFTLTPKLELSAGLAYTQTENFTGTNPGYNISSGAGKSLYPYAQLAGADGNGTILVKDHRSGYTDTAGNGQLLNWQYNPLQEIGNSAFKTLSHYILLTTGLHYRLLNGLFAELQYQYQYSNSNANNTNDTGSYFARDMYNRYTSPDLLSHAIPLGGIADISSTSLFSHQGRAQLNYNLHRGVHQLTAILGTEIRSLTQKGNSYRLYGYDENVNAVSANMDYRTEFPQYDNPYNYLTVPNPQTITEKRDRFFSLYANAAYTLKDRYILSGSIRKDEANLFGVKPNQKGTPLYSIGAAWQVNEEPFYHCAWLPSLKLRITWGVNGNVSRLASAFTTAQYGISPVTGLQTATIITPPNENLRWECTRMLNAGIDFSSKNNRISGSLEWYRKNSSDLLAQAPYDPTLGFTGYFSGESILYANVASMKGSGVDIQFETQNTRGKLAWTTNIIFSYAATNVTGYLLPQAPSGFYINPFAINPVVGKPVYAYYAYKWAGLNPETGDPQSLIGGKPSSDYTAILSQQGVDSLQYIGSVQPLFFGALRNTLAWKQLSLSFNISYKAGYYFRRQGLDYSTLFNSWNGSSEYTQRWQHPGDEQTTSVPSLVYPADGSRDLFYNRSEAVMENAAHIRLEDVILSYQLDKSVNRWLPCKMMRLYANASNLGLLWKANNKDIDPYYNNIPAERKHFTLGINISF